MGAGLWRPRRRGSPHREWRERRAAGASWSRWTARRDWFEGRGDRASLMVMIDNATNWTHAKFFTSETTAAAMTVFQEYVGYYGLPRALYVDRDSIYETTRDSTVDEALQDAAPLTQFGRAMTELEVELILAHSPQAKGRVERRRGVFQDRFVKALRLQDQLAGGWQSLPRDRVPGRVKRAVPRGGQIADRPASERSPGREAGTRAVLQEQRVVQNNWTVSWCNQIPFGAKHQRLGLAQKKILVSELLDGTLRLTYRDEKLEVTTTSPPREDP